MEDPCRHCEKKDLRNQFLSLHYLPGRDLTDSYQDGLIRETLNNLQDSEKKYKHLLECAPDAIFIADAETGIIFDANQKAAELIGIPVEKIIGMHQTKLHPEEEAEKYRVIFNQHIQNNTVSIAEDTYVLHSNGRIIPVQINGAVTHIGDHKVIFGIFRDVTEQKHLQQEIAQRERKYRELYHHAQIALFRNRISDGKLLECNDALARLLGYASIEDCLNRCYAPAHYVNITRRHELLQRLQRDGYVEGFEVEFIRGDGVKGWLEITAKMYPEKGFIEGAQFDITASKVLTHMEKTILDIILQGKSNREIAKTLKRSIRTIEDHRAHIMQKLHAHNLVELVQKAQTFQLDAKALEKFPVNVQEN